MRGGPLYRRRSDGARDAGCEVGRFTGDTKGGSVKWKNEYAQSGTGAIR